jgi:MoxR-like ATPase
LGAQTYPLPQPFLVLATMNPIEQEGTYPLPEAQTDRFMLKVVLDYPAQGGGEAHHPAERATRRRRRTPW